MLDPFGRNLSPKASLPSPMEVSRSPWLETTTQLLAGVALLGALKVGLLTSLLAGLLVYELVHALAPWPSTLVTHRGGKIMGRRWRLSQGDQERSGLGG
jgi:hypothetical protein